MLPLMLACADGPTSRDRTGTDPDPTRTHTGGESTPTGESFSVTRDPTIEAPADPNVALAAVLHLETSAPTTLSVVLDDGASRRRISFPDPASVHARPLLGLAPQTTVTATVTLTGEDGSSVELPPLAHDVPAVPFPLPDLALRVAGPGGQGITWLPAKADDISVLLAVDAGGLVRWARRMEAGIWAVTPGADASVSLLLGDVGPWVLDVGGGGWRVAYDALKVSTAVPIDALDGFTHEATPMPGGGFVSLHLRERTVDGYPTETLLRTRTVTILDPVVVEFDIGGEVVHEWSMADRLDPTRIGFGSNDDCDDRCDWGHANAVFFDPRDDSFLVSLRHQDAVVKLDRSTGEVRWILANHDGWPAELAPLLLTPVGDPFDWPYHQHAPMPHPSDPSLVVMFDNGNDNRTTPYARDPQPGLQSRVVAFRVDEVAGTIAQEWSYLQGSAPDYLYSHVVGNADWLGDDGARVVATWGSLNAEDGERNLARGLGDRSVRVIEFEPESGTAVWDLSLTSTVADRPRGWNVDRAVRAASLYGDSATEETLDP